MNKTLVIALSFFILLTSCTQNTENWGSIASDIHGGAVEQTMAFEIPDQYREVSNEWDITVNGEVIEISWEKLKVWDTLNDATLDMRADYFDQVETTSLADFSGYKLIETVPSLDTPVCTMQTKQLEFATTEFPWIEFLVISNDTPFALQRFCNANGIDNLTVLSDARTKEFGTINSLLMTEYNLLTRAIMIVISQISNTINIPILKRAWK